MDESPSCYTDSTPKRSKVDEHMRKLRVGEESKKKRRIITSHVPPSSSSSSSQCALSHCQSAQHKVKSAFIQLIDKPHREQKRDRKGRRRRVEKLPVVEVRRSNHRLHFTVFTRGGEMDPARPVRSALPRLVLPLLLLSVSLSSSTTAAWDLVLLHTNDVHARVEETSKHSGKCGSGDCFAGVARRATEIKRIRKSESNVLLLDAGDQFQGTVWFNYYKGAEAAHFMNKLRYDAMVRNIHVLISCVFTGKPDHPNTGNKNQRRRFLMSNILTAE